MEEKRSRGGLTDGTHHLSGRKERKGKERQKKSKKTRGGGKERFSYAITGVPSLLPPPGGKKRV